jgi:MFS family permease
MALVAWSIAGFGIGLAYSPISLTALGWARPGSEGRVSASVQLCDVLGTALGTGAAGAAVAIVHQHGGPARLGLGLAFAIASSVGLIALALAPRLPTTTSPRDASDRGAGDGGGDPDRGKIVEDRGVGVGDE